MTGKNEGNWFDDDPEWAELRRRLDKKPIAPAKQEITTPKAQEPKRVPDIKKVVPADNRQISVNITVPKLTFPKFKIPRPLPRKALWGVAVTAVALIVLLSLPLISIFKKSNTKNHPNGTSGVLSDTATKPDYKIILPDGKEDQTAGGKVAYDSQKKVASYTDKIGLANITVSQQPLPESFKTDPEKQLETLAQNFSANELVIASNPKAYLGTSAKGPQTVIFYRYEVLVFIQSSKEISKSDWTDYIRSLSIANQHN